MKPRHQVSRAGVALIKRFEGLRTRAAQLEDGRFTIGYGHTKTARDGTVVSEADAEALLLYDLINVAHAVNEWTFAPLNQNQFDALVSFAFNIGLENFRRSDTLRRVNEGRLMEGALAMELWRKADFEGERIIIDALVRRRAYEKTLFLKPVDAFAPAPSPVLPPKLDYDGMASLPASQPQAVRGLLNGERAIAARDHPPALTAQSPPVPAEPPPSETVPTASEAAAAAVTARLQAMLPEAEFEGPSPELIARLAPPTPHEEAPRDIDVQSPAEPAAKAEPAAEEAQPAPFAPVKWQAQTRSNKARAGRRRIGVALTVLLALIGVALFAAAVRWGFQATGSSGEVINAMALGWGLGVAGLLCVGASAFLLLSRLGEG